MNTVPKPGSKPRIYVAAPYSRGIPDETMAKVADAAERLTHAGWAPFIPHTMTFLWAVRHQHPVEYWYAFDMEWLAACHALVRLPGDSKGADAEAKWAEENGVTVYHSVADAVYALETGGQEPEACARCARPMLRPSQGGPDTPLCDAPCWAEAGAYGRGWWAGFDGYAVHDSEDNPLDGARYRRGYDVGLLARGKGMARSLPGETGQVPVEVLAR